MLLLFSVAAWLMLVSPASAQEIPMLHYTVSDGLPSNTVYQIYRDHKGILWFGTDKGVARYNGARFDVFTTYDGLPDNEIFLFSEDKYDRLWMGTFNGELCYYKNDTFHTAANTPFLQMPFKAPHIRMISQQYDGSLLVCFNNVYACLDIDGERCRVIDVPRSLKAKEEMPVYRQKIAPNRYRLTFHDEAVIVDDVGNIKQRFDIDTLRVGGPSNNGQLSASCQDQEHIFDTSHVYTTDMKLIWDLPKGFQKKNYMREIYFNDNKRLYATSDGLYIDDTLVLLKGNDVSSVTNDLQGSYWASTLNDGVYVFSKRILGAKMYKISPGEVKYAYAGKGVLVFATGSNVIYALKNDNVDKILDRDADRHVERAASSTPVFFIDSDFHCYDLYDGDLVVTDYLSSKKLRVIHTDLTGNIKALFVVGEYAYVKRSMYIGKINCERVPNNARVLTQRIYGDVTKAEQMLGMAKDREGNIWFSTSNNIYKIHDTSAMLQLQFRNTTFKLFDFVGDDLIGITHHNMLLICSNVGNTSITIDTIKQQGCIWDKLYKLDNEHVLFTTNDQYRLLSRNGQSAAHKWTISLIDDPFIPSVSDFICAGNGKCYFFKSGTVTAVDISNFTINPDPPKLFFTTLRTATRSFAITNEVQVPFSEAKNMTISFSTVSFIGKDILRQYSISKNGNDKWVDVKGNEINLVNAGYGTYVVKVRARSGSSSHSIPIEFTIRVEKPFWATLWFIALCLIIVVRGIIWLIRRRVSFVVSKREKDHNAQVRFLRSEYKALNALMNPHFIFNTLNNVQSLVNKNDKLGANEYLRVIADLIRQNMHNISKELIPLQKEIDLVTNYLVLEKLRFKDHLNYSITIEDDLDLTEVMVPPLLIQPLVENSLKHGIFPLESADGIIQVRVFRRRENLCIEVKDNGVGLDRSKKSADPSHESFGLDNIRKRIEQLSIIQNKAISFNIKERTNDIGTFRWTVVTITIPMSDH